MQGFEPVEAKKCSFCNGKGVCEMIAGEIKEVVKSRYGKFAETGGQKESC